MLNWADLSSLLIVLVCTMGGVGGTRAGKARTVTAFLFGVGGFLVGLNLAKVSHRLAYSVLQSRKLTAGVVLAVYGVVPLLFLLLGGLGTMAFAAWLDGQIL